MDNRDGLSKSDITGIDEILAAPAFSKYRSKQRYNVKENVGNVDSNKNKTNNVGNVRQNKKDELLDELLALYKDKPQGIAQIMAEKLGDVENINFHIRVAKHNDPHILFEALAVTQDAQRQGKIKKTLAGYYVGVLRRKGVTWYDKEKNS